jgi:uncharacterized protein YyaL (SSP411 family)
MLEQFGDSDQRRPFPDGHGSRAAGGATQRFRGQRHPQRQQSLAAEIAAASCQTDRTTDGYRREASAHLSDDESRRWRSQPTGFGRLLGALDAFLAPSQEVAIVGDPADGTTQALLTEVRGRYLPYTVVALARPGEESMLPLLQNRGLVDGKPAAYVCENYVCRLPVTDGEALARLLDGKR